MATLETVTRKQRQLRCLPGAALFVLSVLLGAQEASTNEVCDKGGRASNAGASSTTTAENPARAFLACHLSADARQSPRTLWITGELRERAEEILDHGFSSLRVRYWGEDNRTVWILEEVGKELPITIGLLVENDRIERIRILEYRESRGGEVQYPFFTRQFREVGLSEGAKDRLTGRIDGITGATLSVAAVRKTAILALVFHRQTPFSSAPT